MKAVEKNIHMYILWWLMTNALIISSFDHLLNVSNLNLIPLKAVLLLESLIWALDKHVKASPSSPLPYKIQKETFNNYKRVLCVASALSLFYSHANFVIVLCLSSNLSGFHTCLSSLSCQRIDQDHKHNCSNINPWPPPPHCCKCCNEVQQLSGSTRQYLTRIRPLAQTQSERKKSNMHFREMLAYVAVLFAVWSPRVLTKGPPEPPYLFAVWCVSNPSMLCITQDMPEHNSTRKFV